MARSAWPVSGAGGTLTYRSFATKAATKPGPFYMLSIPPSRPVGSAYVQDPAASRDERVVTAAVRGWQIVFNLLNFGDLVVDGWFGAKTTAAARAAQIKHGLVVDGLVGQNTARKVLPVVIKTAEGKYTVPRRLLCGLSWLEASMDLGAVGVNDYDTGPFQINLDPAFDRPITIEQACNPVFAADWSGRNLKIVADRWRGETTVDVWTIAVASHNSPLLARQWAETGKPPFSQARADKGIPQIDEYVALVETASHGF